MIGYYQDRLLDFKFRSHKPHYQVLRLRRSSHLYLKYFDICSLDIYYLGGEVLLPAMRAMSQLNHSTTITLFEEQQ